MSWWIKSRTHSILSHRKFLLSWSICVHSEICPWLRVLFNHRCFWWNVQEYGIHGIINKFSMSGIFLIGFPCKNCVRCMHMFWGMGFHNSCSFVCELFFLKLYGGYCSLSVITGKEFDIFKLDRILCSLPLRAIFFTLSMMWRIMLTRIIIWPFSGIWEKSR